MRCTVSQPTIAITPNIAQFFEEMIADAIRVRHVEATEAAARYLVGVLCDYIHPNEAAGSTFSKPLTFVLHDALAAGGKERFERLRTLGDHVLYALGFFGDHLEQRGVDRRYVLGVGTTAYAEAAAMLRLSGKGARAQKQKDRSATEPDLFSELGSKLGRFVDVLHDVAEGTIVAGSNDQRSVVRLYERWLKTGSSRLAGELGARGIVPTRGGGAIN